MKSQIKSVSKNSLYPKWEILTKNNKHLHIDNTQYGVISSSVSIVNTLFPIFGGIFIDVFGSVWGILTVNSIIILGCLLTALAAKIQSFGLMVAGRVLFGVGSGLIVTMQEAILYKWFRTQNLAIAIGLQVSITRLSNFVGTLAANPIATRTGDWVWSFWLSLILCSFSILVSILYALVVRHLQRGSRLLTSQEIQKLKRRQYFDWRGVLKFPLIYWHILLIEFIYSAVWASFQTISTDFVERHFGSTAVLAGYKASTSQVVPIVAAPLLGVLIDLYGCRVSVLLISSLFLILSTVLLGWTYVNAVIGMILYSISLAFGLVSIISSIGMVLPPEYLGTGSGIYKSTINIGTTILDIVVGVVQDHTQHEAYTGVMILFLVLACVGFVLICTLWVSQYAVLDNLLETGRKRRLKLMKERDQQQMEDKKQGLDSQNTKIRFIHWICLMLFIAAMIVAWVLFFIYSASGSISA
jgi:MFS family permease